MRKGHSSSKKAGLDKPTKLTIPANPAPATFFRFKLANTQSREMVQSIASAARPLVWRRDRDQVQEIEQTSSPQEIVILAAQVSGLGKLAWEERIGQFGPTVLPTIEKQLKIARRSFKGPESTERDLLYENLIGHLRWRGDAGAQILLASFNHLDDYGRSLACVVLGLLKVESSANRLWKFYNKVARNRQDLYLVGPLWGLVDLEDERVSGALVKLLKARCLFNELFGFLSLTGDARAVNPLIWITDALSGEDRIQSLMALVSIGHRIGRNALLVELAREAPSGTPREELEDLTDQILSRPASAAQDYFSLFHDSLSSEDISRIITKLAP